MAIIGLFQCDPWCLPTQKLLKNATNDISIQKFHNVTRHYVKDTVQNLWHKTQMGQLLIDNDSLVSSLESLCILIRKDMANSIILLGNDEKNLWRHRLNDLLFIHTCYCLLANYHLLDLTFYWHEWLLQDFLCK